MTDPVREVKFDDTNEDIMYILENAQNKEKEFLMLAATLHHIDWAFKKRASFDENSWKHMGRRMTLLKKESFDVWSNTRRAKEKKATTGIKESKLEFFQEERTIETKEKEKT